MIIASNHDLELGRWVIYPVCPAQTRDTYHEFGLAAERRTGQAWAGITQGNLVTTGQVAVTSKGRTHVAAVLAAAARGGSD